jgi:hypothetical protein
MVATDWHNARGIVDDDKHISDVTAVVEIGAERGVGPGGEHCAF